MAGSTTFHFGSSADISPSQLYDGSGRKTPPGRDAKGMQYVCSGSLADILTSPRHPDGAFLLQETRPAFAGPSRVSLSTGG